MDRTMQLQTEFWYADLGKRKEKFAATPLFHSVCSQEIAQDSFFCLTEQRPGIAIDLKKPH